MGAPSPENTSSRSKMSSSNGSNVGNAVVDCVVESVVGEAEGAPTGGKIVGAAVLTMGEAGIVGATVGKDSGRSTWMVGKLLIIGSTYTIHISANPYMGVVRTFECTAAPYVGDGQGDALGVTQNGLHPLCLLLAIALLCSILSVVCGIIGWMSSFLTKL